MEQKKEPMSVELMSCVHDDAELFNMSWWLDDISVWYDYVEHVEF